MPAPDYADEYAATRMGVRALLSDLDEASAATVVPACPDWTVHDLCAHLVGVPAALVVRDNPPKGDNQPWVDRQVAERADRSVAGLLDEWDAVGPAFEELMRKLPHAFGGLVYDAVAHEHDLRGALERPGERDSAGIWASLDVMVPMVERDLAAGGPAPGTLRFRTGDREWVVGTDDPQVSLTTTPFELMRLLGSRRSRNQIVARPGMATSSRSWQRSPTCRSRSTTSSNEHHEHPLTTSHRLAEPSPCASVADRSVSPHATVPGGSCGRSVDTRAVLLVVSDLRAKPVRDVRYRGSAGVTARSLPPRDARCSDVCASPETLRICPSRTSRRPAASTPTTSASAWKR